MISFFIYHSFNDYVLYSTTPSEDFALRLSGRTAREKSIIDVLIFGIGDVLHHSRAKF